MTDTDAVTRRGLLRGAALAGAAAAGTGHAAAQETGTATPEGTATGSPSGDGDGGGGGGQTHTVDMTDELVFDPEEITIAPGDTVVWENVGSVGHSVTAYEDDIPSEAEYFASGGFDAEEAARGGYPDQGNIAGGESYEHTFEVTGTYEYFCIPHESVGMLGTVTVQEGGGGAEGGAAPAIPDAAKTLGLGLFFAMLATLGLAYVLLRYGGRPSPEE